MTEAGTYAAATMIFRTLATLIAVSLMVAGQPSYAETTIDGRRRIIIDGRLVGMRPVFAAGHPPQSTPSLPPPAWVWTVRRRMDGSVLHTRPTGPPQPPHAPAVEKSGPVDRPDRPEKSRRPAKGSKKAGKRRGKVGKNGKKRNRKQGKRARKNGRRHRDDMHKVIAGLEIGQCICKLQHPTWLPSSSIPSLLPSSSASSLLSSTSLLLPSSSVPPSTLSSSISPSVLSQVTDEKQCRDWLLVISDWLLVIGDWLSVINDLVTGWILIVVLLTAVTVVVFVVFVLNRCRRSRAVAPHPMLFLSPIPSRTRDTAHMAELFSVNTE